ncbi:hypothetical protein CCM_01994 [Cordyceps militaris CM01]|uniref:Uncharacterized protein n=1 Tax=Cordyceps militaris (strain CM01) TaxID=983644 RepID=G3JC07_CORMM|nr:uncharacterized protein CCM_01994 [Cordyceps militaris CM01]EGX93725.1 hypothetical protein CCM_01994 [Cordyceps militaris CM01]
MPDKIKKGSGKKGDKSNPSSEPSPAVRKWYREHAPSWRNQSPGAACQGDEWPPYYFLQKSDDEFKLGGEDPRGGRIRFIPAKHNGGAGNVCCLLGEGEADR